MINSDPSTRQWEIGIRGTDKTMKITARYIQVIGGVLYLYNEMHLNVNRSVVMVFSKSKWSWYRPIELAEQPATGPITPQEALQRIIDGEPFWYLDEFQVDRCIRGQAVGADHVQAEGTDVFPALSELFRTREECVAARGA